MHYVFMVRVIKHCLIAMSPANKTEKTVIKTFFLSYLFAIVACAFHKQHLVVAMRFIFIYLAIVDNNLWPT